RSPGSSGLDWHRVGPHAALRSPRQRPQRPERAWGCRPQLRPGRRPNPLLLHEGLALGRPPQALLLLAHHIAQHADATGLQLDHVTRLKLAVELERRAAAHRAGADDVARLEALAERNVGHQLRRRPQLAAAVAHGPGLAVDAL